MLFNYFYFYSYLCCWEYLHMSHKPGGQATQVGSCIFLPACTYGCWARCLQLAKMGAFASWKSESSKSGALPPQGWVHADLFWNHCFHIQIEHSHFSPFLINWNYSRILLTHRLITFKDLEFRVKNLEHRILHFKTKKAINTIILLS